MILYKHKGKVTKNVLHVCCGIKVWFSHIYLPKFPVFVGSLTPRDLWSYLYTNPQHCPLTWLETLLHTVTIPVTTTAMRSRCYAVCILDQEIERLYNSEVPEFPKLNQMDSSY